MISKGKNNKVINQNNDQLELYFMTNDQKIEQAFKMIAFIYILIPLLVLIVIIADTIIDGSSRLNLKFLTSMPSRFAESAGILSAMAGSFYLIILTAVISIPVGVGAALYLEEYAKKNILTSIIEININNLAGVPSVIYGLLGLGLFVRFMGLGRSLIAGALTISIMILPIIITSTREALRTVPRSIREAGMALGLDNWTINRKIILPLSLPGILTGIILALSRAIGETAPLITIGALTYIAYLPDSIFSPFTALPIQIFNWVSRPQKDFHINAAAGIVVLLTIMLLMNSFAIILRNRLQKRINY